MKSWLSWPFERKEQPSEPEPHGHPRSSSFPTLHQDSAYQRPRYSSTRSDDLVLRKLGLCNVCMNIDFQGVSTNRKPKERYEVQYGSAGGGQPFSLTCSLCQILWKDILELKAEDAISHSVTFDFTPIHAATVHRGKSSEVLIGVWYRGGSKYGHLVFSASPDDPASVEIKKRPPVRSYNCQESYDIARRWLKECSENHDLCPKTLDSLLPTRVIDIGNSFREPILYTPKPGTRGQYAALSYCWGMSQAVTLTEKRMRTVPVNFPLRTLPRTLKDALIIANHLGFRYIWIDALCIVQDSFEGQDWKQESANMDKIYGNAALTIAAAAACSTTEGIFSFPRSQKQSSCSIPYQLSSGQAGTVFVKPYPTAGAIPESLDTRAWALQEALISPRVLRYGISQMSWKCNMLEENANGPLNTMAVPRTPKDEAWTATVVSYTARSLTYDSDRLAALAGYAKLLAIKRPYDEYIAGLWKTRLLEQLVWYRSSKSDPNLRPVPLNAPTWSWASITSAVNFEFWPDYYKPHCEVVSVSAATQGAISGSELTSLRVHGYVKQLKYDNFFKRSNEKSLSSPSYYFQSKKRNGTDHSFGEMIVDISMPFEAFENGTGGSLICLHMTPTCGLVLVATSKDGSGKYIYERIGLATGTTFEIWFADTTCGLFGDELVRII